jgi:ligand-binding sensor domain-containing protein
LGAGGIINLTKQPGTFETALSQGSSAYNFAREMPNGTVYLSLSYQFYYSTGIGKPFQRIDSSLIKDKRLTIDIKQDSKGNLWIVTLDGIHRFEKSILDRKHYSLFFEGKSVSGCMFDRQDNLWITSLNEGIFLVNNPGIKHYSRQNGLPEIMVTSLFRNKDGVWFGNDRGGIGLIRDQKVQMLPFGLSRVSFGRGRVRGFVPDPAKGNLWAVTENGLFNIENQKIVSQIPTGGKSLCFQKNGPVILGNSYNAHRFEPLEIQQMVEKFGAIRKIGKAGYNESQALMRFYFRSSRQILPPPTRVYSIKEDKNGVVWIATNSGLYSREYNKTLYYKPLNSILGKSFQHLEILEDGTLALGCNGFGIFLVKMGGITVINTRSGLTSNYIKNIRVTGEDSLWVCTPNGLNLLVLGDGNLRGKIRTWTLADGLVSDDLSDVVFLHDTACISSAGGISFYPDFIHKNSKQNIPKSLTRVYVNGLIVPFSNEIKVKEGDAISLSFLNFDYKNLGQQSLRYRLNDHQIWAPIPGNELQIRNIQAGTFKVQVQRRISGSDWSDPETLIDIKVQKPLFENPWVILLATFLFLSVAVVFWYFRFFYPRVQKRSQSNLEFLSVWRLEQEYFVSAAISTLFSLFSSKKNEIGIEYITRFKRLYLRIASKDRTKAHSLNVDLGLVEYFLGLVAIETGVAIGVQHIMDFSALKKEVTLPSFLLVKVIALANLIIGKDEFETQDYTISLAELGGALQFTLEFNALKEQKLNEGESFETYNTLLSQLLLQVKNWNDTESELVEFSSPEIENGVLLSKLFHVWITT